MDDKKILKMNRDYAVVVNLLGKRNAEIAELKQKIERLELEKEAAVDGFKGQFELAKKCLEENERLRTVEQAYQALLSATAGVPK